MTIALNVATRCSFNWVFRAKYQLRRMMALPLALSPLRRWPREPRKSFRPGHRASIPPHLAVIADEAQHIAIDQPDRAQCPKIAPKRLPQSEPYVGDQYLGRQICAN